MFHSIIVIIVNFWTRALHKVLISCCWIYCVNNIYCIFNVFVFLRWLQTLFVFFLQNWLGFIQFIEISRGGISTILIIIFFINFRDNKLFLTRQNWKILIQVTIEIFLKLLGIWGMNGVWFDYSLILAIIIIIVVTVDRIS